MGVGLRDIVMLVVGYGCVPLALYDAYYGLLAYCWLSFMKPQTLVWASEAREARVTFAVAAALIARAMLSEGPRWRPRAPTLAFLAFWAWMALATVTSAHPDQSQIFLEKFSKIGIAVVLLTGLVRTRTQFKYLVLVLALSPGLYALRLGLFLLRGGVRTHHGGPIGLDNNDTALFIAMGIPMLTFAAAEVEGAWRRRGLYALAALGVPAVIAGGSRGGMLAAAAAALLTIWRKTTWWKAAGLAILGATAALALVPPRTMARYRSLESYSHDASAVGRLRAWQTAANMARANPAAGIGPGMNTFMRQYDRYKAHPDDGPRVAHSVWFTTLASTGYVGLALFLLLFATTFRATRQVRRLAGEAPDDRLAWARRYAAMIEVSVITFAVGGSFLSQMGFEYVYAILLLAVPLQAIAQEQAQPHAEAPPPEPAALSRGSIALGAAP